VQRRQAARLLEREALLVGLGLWADLENFFLGVTNSRYTIEKTS
jgi:hypothetical protein